MKQKHLLIFILFLTSFKLFSQAATTVQVTIDTPSAACLPGDCTDLTAHWPILKQTTSYNVSSIIYNPSFPYLWDGIPDHKINAVGDDKWSPEVVLQFPFCFYGVNYTKVLIGTNGVITFDVGINGQIPLGACQWNYSGPIPNNPLLNIKNAIYGVYQDTNIATPPIADPIVQNVNYYFLNQAPNRVLVINFNELPQFSCNNGVGLQTSQIVLYETSNIIDINVQKRTSCVGWNSGSGLIGIQNQAGTSAVVPPGFNTGTWSATNLAWRFTPSGAAVVPTSVIWKKNGLDFPGNSTPIIAAPLLSQNYNTVNVCPTYVPTATNPAPVYTAIVTYNPGGISCGPAVSTSSSISVGLAVPLPVQDPQDVLVCTAPSVIPPYITNIDQDLHILNGLSNSDYEIAYYESNQDAEDQASPITNLTAYSVASVLPPHIIYVRINDTNSGCYNIRPFNIIGGTPSGTIAYPSLNYCNTNPVSQSIITTNLTSGGNYSATPAGLTINSSTGAIMPLTSTSPESYLVKYEITGACAYSTTTPVNIVVCACSVTATNSGPICTGPGATFNLFASAVTGATYQWTGPNGFTSNVQNPTNIPIPTGPGPYIYQVTATSGLDICSGSTTVVVNTSPTISGVLTICEGLTSSLTGSGIPATSSPWTSIDPAVASLSDVGFVINTLPGSTVITYTDSKGCTADATFIALAGPTITGTVSICNGDTSQLVGSGTPSTINTWLSSNTAIATVDSLGLVTSVTSGSATITYTDASGCFAQTPFTINTTPFVSPQTPAAVCSELPFTVSPVNNVTGNIVSAATTYTWTVIDNPDVLEESDQLTGLTNISQTLTNNSNVPQIVIYNVIPTTGTCTGAAFTVTVTINPKPVIPNQTLSAICSGGIFITTLTNGNPSAATIVPASTTYTWTVVANANVTGQTIEAVGQSSVSQTLTNITNVLQMVVYNVAPTSGAAGTCPGTTFTVSVPVNPKPVIPNQTHPPICSGDAFITSPVNASPTAATIVPAGTTYTWTVFPASNLSVISGQSNQTAQTSISQTLINHTNTAQTVVYTVTPTSGAAGNCIGANFTVIVVVNPKPIVANDTVPAFCSGAPFTFSPATGGVNNNSIATGTTYSWVAPTVTGSLTGGLLGTAQTTIVGTLTNPTNVSQTATYTVTPTSGSCAGANFTVTTTVNPKPVIQNQVAAICSGDAFTINPVNATPTTATIVPLNTTYTSTVAVNANVTGQSDQTAQSSITQTLTNLTTAVESVVYTVTPTSGDTGTCPGATFTITVTVNPKPFVSPQTEFTCSGTAFAPITPINGTVNNHIVPVGTTYSWSAPSVTGGLTGGIAATGQTSITGTLTNLTNVPQTATYTVIPSTALCTGAAFTVTVTINPKPVIPNQTLSAICSGGIFITTLTNGNPSAATIVPASTTYTWTVVANANVTGQTIEAVGQSSVSQTLTNITNVLQMVVYNVAPTSGAAGTCPGTTFTVSVPVNPKPVIPNQTHPPICSGDAFITSPVNASPTAATIVPAGTTYTWTVFPASNLSVISGQSNQTAQTSISQTLINHTNTAQTVVYTVTPTSGAAGSCVGTPFTVIVTVNPKPIVANETLLATCSGVPFTLSPATGGINNNSIATGTTYSWVAPTVTGGVITGGAAGTAQTAIFGTLTNVTNIAQTATYTVIPSSGTCIGTPFTVTVPVNPKPVIQNQVAAICSGDAFTINPVNATPTTATIVPLNTTYTWTVAANANVTGQSDQTAQSSITQTLTNLTTAVESVVYTVTPTSGDVGNCPGDTFTTTVTINPTPVAILPNTMNGCSNGTNFYVPFNLALNNNTITNGVANLTVSYYENLPDAQTATNAVALPYTNTSYPQIVYVRVENDLTDCFTTTTLELNVTQGPTANVPNPLEVCDPDSNGFSTFNLSDSINQITGGAVGLQVDFYETQTDALNGFAITRIPLTVPYPNIYQNVQTVYVRVSYALTGCSNFVTLQLIVHDTPQANTIAPLEVCDDNADGYANFDLTLAQAGILGSLNPLLYNVSYYVLEADARSLLGNNPIVNVTNYPNPSIPISPDITTVYVRVEDNATGCFDVVPLGLIVNALPIVPLPVSSLTLCDYTNPGDQVELFDLSEKLPEIIGTQTGLLVSFHFSAAEALTGANPLPYQYSNTSNAQTIHVRVENSLTNCFVTSTMDLRVESLPSPVQPTSIIAECDADGNSFSEFNLASLIPSILNGAPNITITFHETQQDANDGNNAIGPLYTNINQQIQFIYVRAENNLTGCFSTIMIELNANPAPVIPPTAVLQNITKCDTGTNNQNGLTTFDLTIQEAGILAAQTSGASPYTITYHTSELNAEAGTAPIITPANFNNTSNPQLIWVRIKDSKGCKSIGSFQLLVNLPMVYPNPLAPLSLCDDGPSSGLPTRLFDLTVKNNTITGNQPAFTVTYYPSYPDLLANTNVITNPTTYTNIANAQTLGVMVTNTFGCASYGTLDIRVLPLPTPKTDPADLVKCDDNSSPNGTELFDLTTNENYIRNNDPGLTFAYYKSQSDADAQLNAITTPTAYEVGTTIIWIRVMNAQGCYVLVQQKIIVNLLPVVSVSPLVYKICDTTFTGIQTFTLDSMNSTILGAQNPPDFAITYHLTPADALTGANPLLNSYPNTSNPQVIYIRMVNNITGCVNPAGTMTLSVVPGALIGTPVPWKECDYEFSTPTFSSPNGVTTFDLTQLDAQALTGQNPTLFTVAYFDNLADAAAGTNAISNLTTYQTATTTICIVVTNTTTLCRSDIKTISLVVEPLAEPVITSSTGSNTICVQWITGTATDPLLSGLTLNSGITDPNYTFEWKISTDGGATFNNIPGAIFATHIIDTVAPGDYTVVATSVNPPMLGCVSELSNVFTVIQSGPAAPIGTGYEYITAFEDIQNIIVTVNGYGTYHYQLDSGPILDNGGVFNNVTFGTHTIKVYDVKGNTACDLLTISNISIINYPHFFTPNGDGTNDQWNIVGLDSQTSAKIYIFDRFGKLVKQISSASSGWDGTFNGELMPATDYWFTVQFSEQGADRIFKAHFSLKR